MGFLEDRISVLKRLGNLSFDPKAITEDKRLFTEQEFANSLNPPQEGLSFDPRAVTEGKQLVSNEDQQKIIDYVNPYPLSAQTGKGFDARAITRNKQLVSEQAIADFVTRNLLPTAKLLNPSYVISEQSALMTKAILLGGTSGLQENFREFRNSILENQENVEYFNEEVN